MNESVHGGMLTDRSPAMITTRVAVNFIQAREAIENELSSAVLSVSHKPKDADGMIAAYNSIHVGRKLQVIFLSGELRELFVSYVTLLLDALVTAERLEDADNILERYSRTGTGNLHSIKKFWKE